MKQYEITSVIFFPIKSLLWDGKKARFQLWLDSFIPLNGIIYEDPTTLERWIGFKSVGMRTAENSVLFDWLRDVILSKYAEIDKQ